MTHSTITLDLDIQIDMAFSGFSEGYPYLVLTYEGECDCEFCRSE